MAGLNLFFTSSEFTLATSAGWKTLAVLEVPANVGIILKRWSFLPRGTVNTDKHVRVRLSPVSDLGTGGVDKSTEIGKKSPGRPESIQSKAWEAPDGNGFTVEPTISGKPIVQMAFHPQQPMDFPAMERHEWEFYGGQYVAVQYNNSGGAAVPAGVDFHWEE